MEKQLDTIILSDIVSMIKIIVSKAFDLHQVFDSITRELEPSI